MRIINCEQRSDEWYQVRCGRPTASRFAEIVTSTGERSKQRTKYLYQLAGEAATGVLRQSYRSASMDRGAELEDEARLMYEAVTDYTVIQVGFCLSDCETHGASPDGLIEGEQGCLEIKCPEVDTHIEYLLAGKLPTKYIQQVQGQMMVTGAQWCDFVSYFPGLNPLIVRVERNERFIGILRNSLIEFCAELNELVTKIKR